MTKDEKRRVAELLSQVSDLAVGMERDWNPDAVQWEKKLYWQRWDPKKARLETDIVKLTGVYVPIG